MTTHRVHDAIDTAHIANAVSQILHALPVDPESDGLRGTPQRVAEMYSEVFSGLGEDPIAGLRGGFDAPDDDLVVARSLRFYSMCEHHLLPFFGVVHVGYVPAGRIVGIGRLARTVEILARRPQVQERLTAQIADAVVSGVAPAGVGVIVEAEHLCLAMRGVRAAGTTIFTSAMRGTFREDAAQRAEFERLAR